MNDDGIREAERRVREMNNMTRQYAMQGNGFLQNMQNMQNSQNTPNMQNIRDMRGAPKPRFEPAANNRKGQGTAAFQGGGMPRYTPEREQRKSGQSRTPMPQRDHELKHDNTPQTGFDLSKLNPDSEKLMIIMLMYLLIKEKADMKLVLALGYLLF